MIDFNKLANAAKTFGQLNNYIIPSKTANSNAKILSLVIFFRSSNFIWESSL